MKITSLLLACLAVTAFTTPVFALSIEREITAAYVQEHPQEFSVKAARDDNGLIHFTITHNVSMPMYHVVNLSIYHQDKLLATTHTTLFGRKRDNTFEFSIPAEDVAASKFDLSDSALDSTEEVPVPGTIISQFRLSDFVPKDHLPSGPDR